MKNGLVVNDGTKRWYLNGALHREDGPAVEYWYVNGIYHRLGGPAIEYPDGGTSWYLNGKLHRVDGPAINHSVDDISWWLHGKLHRVDGPAEEFADGSKFWYLHGEELIHPECFESMEEWLEYLNDNEEQTYQLIHDINGFIGFIVDWIYC